MKYPQLVSMPSAVSVWLEEQLEARGIDAVVYTRYVLSLLHTHTVDVIYPDEDLQFSRLKKEVRRSSGSRKRFRRSSDWWRHAQADAEQIKRSAAVECLMSASDQNCEIESLVDELCEKLKEVDSESSSPSDQPDSTSTGASKEIQKYKITPQELAEKYYAAFPPLCPQSPSKLTSLLPKWKPTNSPIKNKNIRQQSNRLTTYDSNSQSNIEVNKVNNQHKHYLNYLNRTMDDMCISITDNKNYSDVGTLCDSISDENDSTLDEVTMFDLPVDIKNLLDSPCADEDTVEMMNMANMTDIGKRNFVPYGTNITSSIWSNNYPSYLFDKKFNAAMDDFKLTLVNKPWPSNRGIENGLNILFDGEFEETHFAERMLRFCENTEPVKKECSENEALTASLMKLNHNKEKSCFIEIIPKSKPVSQVFNPCNGQMRGMFNSFSSRQIISLEREREDLLDSENSHFRPINEKMDSFCQGDYADGATFNISNNLEKVDYKRSESGSMLLETEFGQSKKYQEYKLFSKITSPNLEFTLRFSICQIDKACQTEDLSKVYSETIEEEYSFFSKSDRFMARWNKLEDVKDDTRKDCLSKDDTRKDCLSKDDTRKDCLSKDVTRKDCLSKDNTPEDCLSKDTQKDCLTKDDTSGGGLVNSARPESIVCDEPREYKSMGWMDPEWERLRDIWKYQEVHDSSQNLRNKGNRPPPSLELREDISQDGEQLFSDLWTLQNYMNGFPPTQEGCGIKERKRRHSFITTYNTRRLDTRLEEDCLIQISTLPSLHFVTL